ncbi:hypothetical protein DFQ26_000411 [Actinomortierella ambigua]|nr:hypothetical protein DFQ26_000411 [Actinomortierella ambigua]
MVNGYNPDLLTTAESNMDIQINTGVRALAYISKYISKPANVHTGRFKVDHDDNDDDLPGGAVRVERQEGRHVFVYQHMSMPEMVLDLTSSHVSGKSRSVLYLSTHMAENERRVLRRVQDMPPEEDSEDIFYQGHWEKYLTRPAGAAFDALTYPQFFTEFYVAGQRQANAVEVCDNFDDVPLGAQFVDTSIGPRRRQYRRYQRDGAQCVVRTRATPVGSVDDACVHLLKLHHPMREDLPILKANQGVATYFELASVLLPEATMERVQAIYHAPEADAGRRARGRRAWEQMNGEQRAVVQSIEAGEGGRLHLVTGSAGTGKSTVIAALIHALHRGGRYEAIVLAPSGIAASNVDGMTIHRFLAVRPQRGGEEVVQCQPF